MKLYLKLLIGIWLGLWVSLASANATFTIDIVNQTGVTVSGQIDDYQTSEDLYAQRPSGYHPVLNNQASNVYSLSVRRSILPCPKDGKSDIDACNIFTFYVINEASSTFITKVQVAPEYESHHYYNLRYIETYQGYCARQVTDGSRFTLYLSKGVNGKCSS